MQMENNGKGSFPGLATVRDHRKDDFGNLLKTGGLSQALQAPLDPGPEMGSGPMLGEDERRKTLDPTISS
jgi:hypothetical protein